MITSDCQVLHVIPSLGIGGAEGCLQRLVEAQSGNGTMSEVVTLLPATGSVIEAELARSGIEVHALNMSGAWSFPRAVLKLAKVIRAKKPHAVQSWLHYGDLTATLAVLMSGRKSRTRLIWGVRSSRLEFSNYGSKLGLVAKACAKLSPLAHVITANSEAGRMAHVALGYSAANFEVVYNGIDIERFVPLPGPERAAFRKSLSLPADLFVVVMAARLDPQKDYETFLKVVEDLPGIQFVVAGSGTEALPARPNLRTLGLFANMANLFGCADCVLSTSAYGEGFPNTVAEAMACGTPAVATDVGDVAIIMGDTGVLTAPRDIAALVSGINVLARETDADRSVRRAAARCRIVDQFALQEMVRNFTRLQKTA